jgi:hypothetical protein
MGAVIFPASVACNRVVQVLKVSRTRKMLGSDLSRV